MSTQIKQLIQETYHTIAQLIKVSPYEAEFGLKPHRDILQAGKRQAQNENDEGTTDQSTAEHADDMEPQPQAGKRQAKNENDEGTTDQSTAEHADDMEPPQKRKKIIENQRKYNII